MADNYVPVTWPVWTPGTWLSGFIKKITEYCYAQNIKALGLMVSEKRAFVCFIEPLGLVVSGKIFSWLSHFKPMADNDAPGV